MAPLYSVNRLSCIINGKPVLKDISFETGENEYIAVIGANGAGKTTLIRHLNRIIRPRDRNAVLLRGRPIGAYTQKEIARIVSYVPQSPTHIQHFTVHEFVLMGRYPYLGPFASPTAKDDRAVSESMDITDVSRFADRDMVTLSGGELQKVYIAAGLAQGGAAVLLDEPATFLDPRHRHEIFTILQKIHSQGKTVISVTHDINTAVLTASRVLAMKDGTIVFDGEAQDVMDNSVLRNVYGKPFSFAEHPETGIRIAIPDVYLETGRKEKGVGHEQD
jgi:iron complex transport system ATP-binding protein